jgi:hypothetical protein
VKRIPTIEFSDGNSDQMSQRVMIVDGISSFNSLRDESFNTVVRKLESDDDSSGRHLKVKGSFKMDSKSINSF